MLEQIRQKIGSFIVFQKYYQKGIHAENFRGFINNSSEYFILMPDKEEDFREAFQLIEFLILLNKNVTIFIRDLMVSQIPHRQKIQYKNNLKYVDWGINDFSKFYIPSKKIIDDLRLKKVDVLIDLNLSENIYCTLAASIINSKFKICFRKGSSDRFYNFQIINNNENNSAISYRNLLNSLQMF